MCDWQARERKSPQGVNRAGLEILGAAMQPGSNDNENKPALQSLRVVVSHHSSLQQSPRELVLCFHHDHSTLHRVTGQAG